VNSVYLNQAFIIGFGIPKLYKWIHLGNGVLQQTTYVILLLAILVIYSWGTQYLIELKFGKRLNSIIKN